MARICNLVAALGFLAFALVGVPGAAKAEKRIALVIGNAGYQAKALATPANDAGLIAQTLQAAGFDVVGARELCGPEPLERSGLVPREEGSDYGAVAFRRDAARSAGGEGRCPPRKPRPGAAGSAADLGRR
jgi:hypothetical protein